MGLAFHTNPFDEKIRYENGPFEAVLLFHGHDHELTLDRPASKLDLDKPAVSHPNLLRLEVYGWPDVKAAQVNVDTSKRWVFGFEPRYAADSVSTHPGSD